MRRKNYVKPPRQARSAGKKWVFISLLVLTGLWMLWSLIMGEMGAVKYFRMHVRESTLRAEIAHLKQDNLRLMQQVRSLKQDPAYIERIARDEIGLARPGEIVYYYSNTVK